VRRDNGGRNQNRPYGVYSDRLNRAVSIVMPRKAHSEQLGDVFSFEDAERVAAEFQAQADALPAGDDRSELLRKAVTYRALAEMKRFLKPKAD
jgi:hypothetical protein